MIGDRSLGLSASAQVRAHIVNSGQRCQIGKERTPHAQRSQVQILPPLQCDVAGHRGQRTYGNVGPLLVSGGGPGGRPVGW
jgi:hypothetical protein